MLTDGEIQVWVVEDNVFLRDTVAELLDAGPGMCCTLAAGACEDALVALQRGRVPDVVLMGLGLPGMGSIEGIRRITVASPSSAIVVLSVHENDDRVFDAICAGASGYLLKPASAEEIVHGVEMAVRGASPMNAFIARKVLTVFARTARPRVDPGLTDRELEILDFLVDERSQKQIAHALGLSPHTVDTHLRNIYAKLQAHSRSGAVAKALQDRLI